MVDILDRPTAHAAQARSQRRDDKVADALDTPDLINHLAAEAMPVRRLAAPWLRALMWLSGAALAIGVIVAMFGIRPDLSEAMARPGAWLAWAASIATGVSAAIAAFYLVLPDRSPRWALFPLPVTALWASSLGVGCYADWLQRGPDGLLLGDSYECFLSILIMSVIVGLPLVFMLRHAVLVRPALTAAMGGLAVASLASAGLELFHHHDARMMDIIWHVLAVAAVVTISSAVSSASSRRAVSKV